MEEERDITEKNKKPRKTSIRRRRSDPSFWLQDYLGTSRTPEEALFKINELLNAGLVQNTRRNVRVPLGVAVVFTAAGQSHASTTYTLSQKGCYIKWPEPPASGTPIEVEIHLPDFGPAVHAEGKVVQSVDMDQAALAGNLSGMSVVFDKIRTEDRRRIDKLVRSHARRIRKNAQ